MSLANFNRILLSGGSTPNHMHNLIEQHPVYHGAVTPIECIAEPSAAPIPLYAPKYKSFISQLKGTPLEAEDHLIVWVSANRPYNPYVYKDMCRKIIENLNEVTTYFTLPTHQVTPNNKGQITLILPLPRGSKPDLYPYQMKEVDTLKKRTKSQGFNVIDVREHLDLTTNPIEIFKKRKTSGMIDFDHYNDDVLKLTRHLICEHLLDLDAQMNQ